MVMAMVTATQQRWQQRWSTATATAIADGNGDGDGVGNDNGNGDGDCNGDGHGEGDDDKGRVASSCARNVQHYGRGDTLPPLPWTQRKVIHQCCVMGVTLLRVFPPFQGGGFLTSSP